jgi:hypothetical protein
MTSEQSSLDIETWEYNPSEQEKAKHRSGLAALTHILNTLPALVKSSLVTVSTTEYPKFDLSSIPDRRWIAADARGREVFRIDDRLYFRRHADNWNSTVVYGSIQDNKIVWRRELSMEELLRLAETL